VTRRDSTIPAGSAHMAVGPRELDERELMGWGRRLGRIAAEHAVFAALSGPLGAGKTTLVQAACAGAETLEPATSPTFTLVSRYAAPGGPIYHVDLYRIRDPGELVELGWDDLASGEHPVWVEWAERAGPFLPADRWDIRLSIPEGGRTRIVTAEPVGRAPRVPDPESV
jgi:tRNA threonylcarbamoyladenosine biosynthesis protein TsaE